MPVLSFNCLCNPKKKLYKKIAAHDAALSNYSKNFRRSVDIERITLNGYDDSFEEDDRKDICCMLPNLRGKKILDIGFGIGRYTVELASLGKYAYATDLLPGTFVQLNELKKLAKKSKKTIKVDASNIYSVNYRSNKFHLIFTHWMFKYLSDEECLIFLTKSLLWLKKGGYLKFRESCGESTTKIIDETNNISFESLARQSLTNYRYISVYLKLIEEIRIKDKRGRKWKYNVCICSVIPTCIEKALNWKEIQLIAKKVPVADEYTIPDKEELLDVLNGSWVISQEATDIYVGITKQFFADNILLHELERYSTGREGGSNVKTATLIYQSQCNPYYMRICPFNMPTSKNSFIWTNEENQEIFKSYLSIADRKKLSSMFFSYSKINNINSLLGYIGKREVLINSFLAINFLTDYNFDFIDEFMKVARPGAKIILLESYINPFDQKNKLQKLRKYFFIVKCRTKHVHKSLYEGNFPEGIKKCITSKKWMLITISPDTLGRINPAY